MTFREILVGYPGTKSIDAHPYYRGAASRWAWRLYHHRFTRAGRWTLAIAGLAAFTFFVFWSLDTQTWVAALFMATPYLISAFACLFPPDVDVHAVPPARVVIGTPFSITVRITRKRKRAALDWRIFPLDLPDGLDAVEGDGTAVAAMTDSGVAEFPLPLIATRRGVHRVAGWRVASDFPFGLLDAYRIVRSPLEIVVLPRAAAVRVTALNGGMSRRTGGPESVTSKGDTLEFSGNRPWRLGDRPRDVDWRATARHLGSPDAALIVREWHKSEETPVVVLLDLALSPQKRKPWHAMEDPTRVVDPLVEAAVSIAAGVVESCRGQHHDVRLIDDASTSPRQTNLLPYGDLQYRLAAAQPARSVDFDSDRVNDCLPAGTAALVWIATFWDPARSEYRKVLQRSGLNVTVLVVVPNADNALDDAAVTVVPAARIDGLRVDI